MKTGPAGGCRRAGISRRPDSPRRAAGGIIAPMSFHQRDLFAPPQPVGDEPPAVFRGDPERVRARLAAMLAEARGAAAMDRARLRLLETIVPQMSAWLDADEAEGVRRDFGVELARLRGQRLAVAAGRSPTPAPPTP